MARSRPSSAWFAPVPASGFTGPRTFKAAGLLFLGAVTPGSIIHESQFDSIACSFSFVIHRGVGWTVGRTSVRQVHLAAAAVGLKPDLPLKPDLQNRGSGRARAAVRTPGVLLAGTPAPRGGRRTSR